MEKGGNIEGGKHDDETITDGDTGDAMKLENDRESGTTTT